MGKRPAVTIAPMSHSPFSVQVEPRYLAEQSSAKDNIYTFSYTVAVTNAGTVAPN